MAFKYCLNTSTIRAEGTSPIDAIDTAADAGYEGIEPWVSEIDAFVEGGGSLADVRARAEGRGIQIVNLIAFPEWAVPEDDRREAGLEELKRCLEMAKTLGCPFLAAPPRGIHDRVVDIFGVAERYGTVVDIAKDYGVTPLLEYWGIAKTLGRTGEALLVAAECGRPRSATARRRLSYVQGKRTSPRVRTFWRKPVGAGSRQRLSGVTGTR